MFDEKKFAACIEKIDKVVDRRLDEMTTHAEWIGAHPEIGEKEFETSKRLAGILNDAGFETQYPYLEMPTAFNAVKRTGEAPVYALLTEYDALPGIGHACGHSLHGMMSVFAGIALAETLGDFPGTLRVVGTPAEETNGAKVTMSAKGVFDDVDLAAMIHSDAGKSKVVYNCLAMDSFEFTFTGKTAHAAASPWEGRNALNGAQLFFHAVDMMRQHIRPEMRIHGVIKEGGLAPNIVPDKAVVHFYFRGPKRKILDDVVKKMFDCARGAALATQTEVAWRKNEFSFDDMLPCPVGEEAFTRIFEELGETVVVPTESGGSSDVGNVSYRCPTLQPRLAIVPQTLALHTVEFEKVVVSGPAMKKALKTGTRALARMGLRLFADTTLREALHKSFKEQKTVTE